MMPPPMISDRASLRPATLPELKFLQLAARLLLEYNFRSELVKDKLARAAGRLGITVQVYVAYRGVTLYTPEGHQFHAQAKELRINVAVSSLVSRIVERFTAGELPLADATAALETAERDASHHSGLVMALAFGCGAAALAWLLRADTGAIVTAGVSSGLGLLARRELARRHVLLFALPFTAAFIGALIGGIAIRLGFTATGLCLLVPFLMIVPGPHLINGVYDMTENHIQTGLSRLGLATVLLFGAALGVYIGARLTLGTATFSAQPSEDVIVTFAHDVILAGIASCGFGVAFNAPWRTLSISILSGMIGHGLRYLCLHNGVSLEIATFLACLPIGIVAGIAVEKIQVPFAAVAFAGAVPMMPGAFIFQAITGALAIGQGGATAEQALVATTLAGIYRSAFVVAAMAFGLLIGGHVAGVRGSRH